MKKIVLILLAIFCSGSAISQNKGMADSLDRDIKSGFKKTLRTDYQTDSAYSSYYFKKESKEIVEVVVTTRQTETNYDFLNEQLVRVRVIDLNPPGNRTVYGKYYFLNTSLIYIEETGMKLINPLDLLAQADKAIKLAKKRIN